MSSGSESLSSKVALDASMEETGVEFCKDSRIAYTRESLLSLSELHVLKELPSGFDRSNLSELNDAYASEPEQKKLLGQQWLSTGGTNSKIESPERWDSCKLSSTDGNSRDSGRCYGNQFRYSWNNTGTSGTLKNSLKNHDHNGIQRSWSSSKIVQDGSEGSDLNQRADHSLLSRCSKPYRPPSLYKEMSHLRRQNHDSFNSETFGCAECPSKERSMEEQRRKASFELTRKEQLKGVKEKQKSSPETCELLENCSAVPVSNSDRSPSPIYSADSSSVELPYAVCEAADKYLTKEYSDSHPLIQENFELNDSRDGQGALVEFDFLKKKEPVSRVCFSQRRETKINKILAVDDEQKHILHVNTMTSLAQEQKGTAIAGKESHKLNRPLTSAPDHSDVRRKLLDDSVSEILQSSSCTEHQDTFVDGTDSCRSHSKFGHWFPDNDKATSSFLSWGDKNGKKVWGESTGMSMKDYVLEQLPSTKTSLDAQKSSVSEATKLDVSDRPNSCPLAGNSCFPYQITHDSRHAQKPQLDKVITDQVTEGSKLNPISTFGEETDSTSDLHLPDEDSLITIDDTFILQQDMPIPSPNMSFRGGRSISSFPGSLKLMGSESLNLQGPWLHNYPMSASKLLANPSDSQEAPSAFRDPRKIYHNNYYSLPGDVVPHPFGRLPLETRKYEPFIQHSASPTMQQAENLYPHLFSTRSAEPSIHHQAHQIPCFGREPSPLGTLPVNYQRNSNSTVDVGKRVVLREEGKKSTFSRLLQMQMRLAQMNLEEQRAFGKPISNRFR